MELSSEISETETFVRQMRQMKNQAHWGTMLNRLIGLHTSQHQSELDQYLIDHIIGANIGAKIRIRPASRTYLDSEQ